MLTINAEIKKNEQRSDKTYNVKLRFTLNRRIKRLYCCFYLYFLCLLFIFCYIVDYYIYKGLKEQEKE